MKKFVISFLLPFTFSVFVFSQSIVLPSIRYGSQFNSVSLSGSSGSLLFEGNSSVLFSTSINGYPAVGLDSCGGYFTFTSSTLLGKPNALFLTVYQLEGDSLCEQGLWSLHNGVRNKGLSSTHSVEGRRRIQYNYIPASGVNVTTNYVKFSPVEDPSLATVDTFYIGKTDSLLFSGKLAEFMVIDTAFSDVERQVWQSYLSLKYGATIYQGDYVNSSGDTLWRHSSHQEFSSGVGGIGRDNLVSLCQNFSRIYGDSVKISLHNYIFNEQQTSSSPFSDGEYIFWGHDGYPPEVGYDFNFVDNSFYHLYQRKWEVLPYLQSTQPLDIELYASPVPGSSQVDLSLLKLFVSDNAGFNSYGTQLYVPSIIDGNKVIFSDISIPCVGGVPFYFTFGYSSDDISGSGNGSSGSGGSQNGGSGNPSQNPANDVFTQASYLPNPVIDNLYVDYTLTRDAVIWFSVHSNGGIPLCQTPAEHRTEGVNQTIIPMSGLITGTYIVYIHVDDMVLMQTVIKK